MRHEGERYDQTPLLNSVISLKQNPSLFQESPGKPPKKEFESAVFGTFLRKMEKINKVVIITS